MVSDNDCDVAVCDIKGRGDFPPPSDFVCTSYIQNLCLRVHVFRNIEYLAFSICHPQTINSSITHFVCVRCVRLCTAEPYTKKSSIHAAFSVFVYGTKKRTVHKKIQYLCGFQPYCVRLPLSLIEYIENI